MRVELICIGSELLNGKINTHAAYIGRLLRGKGYALAGETVVPDALPEISSAVKTSLERSGILIICGGLGPTFDDITREAAARALGKKLVFSPDEYALLLKKIRRYKRGPTSFEKRQALFIEGAVPIPNTTGMAPGQLFFEKNRMLCLLPGPFNEMQPMMERVILPFIQEHFPAEHSQTLRFNIFGIGEALIDRRIRPLIGRFSSGRGFTFTYSIIAHASTVSLYITGTGRKKSLRKPLGILKKKMHALFGAGIFSENDDTLLMKTVELLAAQNKTIATAESCTGGLLTSALTSLSGSSVFFKQGLIVYSNVSKIKLLGVPADLIKQFGAVSRPVARMMADRVRYLAETDIGISITGIAGPGGATSAKPLGLVFIGITAGRRIKVIERRFPGDRSMVRERALMTALDLLRKELL